MSSEVEKLTSEFYEEEELLSTDNLSEETSGADESVSEVESEASVSAESENSSEVEELQIKRSKVEPAPVSVMETPQPQAKPIFGSAAKNIVSFTSLSGGTALPVKSLFAQAAEQKDSVSEEAKKPEVNSNYEVVTGEEDEDTLTAVKGKLFEFNMVTKDWSEKGVGTLKLNMDSKLKKYRLIMRTDAVQKLVLNSRVYTGMLCEIAQPKNLRFSAHSLDTKIQTYLFRTKNIEDAENLEQQIKRVLNALETIKEEDC